jgi:hypothetical protein
MMRLGMKKYSVVELVQAGKEFAGVIGAAIAQPLEIDASRKDIALPR